MPVERSAGAIVFCKENNEIYYLLLPYPNSSSNTKKEYWGFPKGHIERGEKIEETAKREVEEETGLKDIKFINGFKEQEKYFFTEEGKKIFKTVNSLLAETKTKEIKISSEHLGFKWLSYEEALKQLTFKNAKEILKKAHKFLSIKKSLLF